MGFDVEGARKAGYSDGEIADFLARDRGFDLAGARDANYTDSEIVQHLAAQPASAASQIPGNIPVEKKPEPGIGEKVVGAGEAGLQTVTGMVGGLTGLLGGGSYGVLEDLIGLARNGAEYRRAKGAGPEARAATVTNALTYEPRTESGKDQGAAVAEAMQNVPPVIGVHGTIPGAAPRGAPLGTVARSGVEQTVRAIAGEPAAAATLQAMNKADQVAAMAKTGVTTLPRRALEALRREPEASPTSGTLGSAGSAGTDMASQRVATAEALGFTGDSGLTKGQRSRDAAQLKFETENSKMPEQGAPLRQRVVNQTAQVLRNMDNWFDLTGAEAPSLRAVGQVVDKAVVEQAARDKTEVNVAYTKAKKSPEAAALVDQGKLVQIGEGDSAISGTPLSYLNDQPVGLPSTALTDAARQYAVKLGIADLQDGQLVAKPASIRQLEDWRKAIGQATGYEPADVRNATILKAMIDAQTEPVAGPLFRQARALRARFAQNYEDRATISKLLDTKGGSTDRRVALEDVFKHSIIDGSLDDVRNVRRVLQRGGSQGEQAWRELQGQTMRQIKDQATRGVATDGAGNQVISPAGLDKAVRELDVDGRLDFIFGKKGAQQVRDLNEIAKVIKTVPPEAGINTSNTAATLLAAMADAVFVGGTGTPVPVVSIARAGLKHIQDVKLRNRIQDALDGIEKKAPGKKKPALQAPPKETIH